MGYDVVEWTATLSESLITADFMVRFLGAKSEKKKWFFYFLCTCILVVDITIQNNLTEYEGLAGLSQVLICFCLAALFLRGKNSDKIFASVMSCIFIILINIIVMTVTSKALSVELEELIGERGPVRLLMIFVSKFLFYLVTRFFISIKRKDEYSLTHSEWAMILMTFFTTLIIAICYFKIALENSLEKDGKYSIIITIGLIFINVVTYILLLRASRENKEKLKYALMELQLKEQEYSMREINERYTEIMTIRHDMKNYIGCGLTLMKENRDVEALEYFEKIAYDKIGSVIQYVSTSSNIINAVINSKFTKAKEDSIEFKCNITGSLELFDEVEIAILLSNLLDNAIEASRKNEKERKITIEIFNNKSYLNIIVGNIIEGSVLAANPNLATSKAEKKKHGIGINSIKDIAKKHDGTASFHEDNCRFLANILLKIPNN